MVKTSGVKVQMIKDAVLSFTRSSARFIPEIRLEKTYFATQKAVFIYLCLDYDKKLNS